MNDKNKKLLKEALKAAVAAAVGVLAAPYLGLVQPLLDLLF